MHRLGLYGGNGTPQGGIEGVIKREKMRKEDKNRQTQGNILKAIRPLRVMGSQII